MYKNLKQYIDFLDSLDQIERIKTRVDPVYEIAEITDRVSKSPGGGKALLFEETGTGFPVLTNMMGSDRRIAAALGVGSLDEISARLHKMLSDTMSPKEGLWDKLAMLPLMAEAARWVPKKLRGQGECHQVVYTGDQVDLGMLPVLKCWPYDGGRFVTLPLVHTVDPDTGARNVGMYRMQVTGPRTTGMHWHLHKTGERHYRAYVRRGERMPVSVCLGGDPVYTYSATAPMPDNLDEYLLAGFLRGRSVRLVKCLTNDIYVPADCDIVIEGYVDPAEDKFMEGPFGDHTGFYSLEDLYPRFHVTAITHRRDAVYPATVVGIPPQEDAYIAKATEKIFLAPIRAALQPEVTDLYMPPEGVAHNLAVVAIEKQYPGQAFKTASSMWGAGQMMFNKILLVAGEGTDVRNAAKIARLVRNSDPGRDLLLSKGVLDVLDHSAAATGLGGKAALDLTNIAEEEPGKQYLSPAGFPSLVAGINRSFEEEWSILVLYADPACDIDPVERLAISSMTSAKYIVVTDVKAQGLGPGALVWFCAGNTDPGRDLVMQGDRLFIDARTKFPRRPGYPARVPNVVLSGRETIELVDSRWKGYGIGPFTPSPSVEYSALQYSPSAAVTADKHGKKSYDDPRAD